MYIYVYYVKRENEKSICHWYATLSFLPLHSSGIKKQKNKNKKKQKICVCVCALKTNTKKN